MEQHLANLLQNTLAIRHKKIHDEAQLALDTLDTQKLSFHFKAWQIRGKCLSVMQLALESFNPALCNIGLGGIEYVVVHPDLDRLAGEEQLDATDCKLFALQVLGALQSLPNLTAEHQLCGMKILLNLCCNFVSSFEGDLIINIMQMCLACWHKEKKKVHSAIIQLCAAYTMQSLKFCAETCGKGKVDPGVNCAAESVARQAVERLANADIANSKNNGKLADVIGLAMFFVKQVKLSSKSDNDKGVYLECLLAVLKTLKLEYVMHSSMFASYVSNDLCPTLAATISLNTVTSKPRLLKLRKRKKMKKQKNASVTLNGMLHRKVALIAVEVVRLVGSIASLRPHVGLVFSHLLSATACAKHGIPFNILNKLWSTPEMLFNLAGPFLVEDLDVKQNCTSILQLMIDAMIQVCYEKVEVESVTTISNIQCAVKSMRLLLETLDKARLDLHLKKEKMYPREQNNSEHDEDSLKRNIETLTAESENKVILQSPTKSSTQSENSAFELEKGVDDLSDDDDDDTDDVWVSSEDIFTAMSSPYYQSAAEDEEELNGMKTETSKLYGLMQYIVRSKLVRDSTSEAKDDDCSTASVSTDTADQQVMESDEDISKYIDDVVLSEDNGTKTLIGLPEATRDAVLARRFYDFLNTLTPQLLHCDETSTVDQMLQKAASQFCSDIYEKWKLNGIVVQAGSLYTLSYSILLLTLRLKLSGHYDHSGAQLPCVKSQWVTYQQSCGVYLSKSWLSETFRKIIIRDILENARCESTGCDILITMLGEIDGLGCRNSNEKCSVKKPLFSNHIAPSSEEGTEFAKQVLVSVWSDVVQVLQCPLLKVLASKDSSSSLFLALSSSSIPNRSENERDCIVASIDVLKECIKLSHALGLYNLSSMVITPMVDACVPRDYTYNMPSEADDEMRLHITPVLFVEVLCDVAIDVGRHSRKSWDAFLKIVAYVAYLDHLCFQESSPNVDVNEKLFDDASSQQVSITELIEENKADGNSSNSNESSSGIPLTSMGFLTHRRSAKAVYSLSRKIDALFEEAAKDLDLRTVTDFLWSLCVASNRQLFNTEVGQGAQICGTPLLYRLGECILATARLGRRPLLHVTNLWRYSAPHFTKVLGHKNTHYAKQAGTYIYNMVTTVLSYPRESTGKHSMALWSDQEPKYFHFVEELLLPFERAMQSEMCDTEVQGLIVGAISQLVETSSNRICSGWRPLFSALKHITHNQQTMDRSPIFEVFNAFFVASSSPVVLASAAHDCINCLLKLLGSIQDEAPADSTPILRYLEEIGKTILDLHQNNGSEHFSALHSFTAEHFTTYDSAVWKKLSVPLWLQTNDQNVSQVVENLNEMTERCFNETSSGTSDDSPNMKWNDHTRLLHTWFHLLDGLALRTLTSPKPLQPLVLELLCKLLQQSPTDSGFPVSCYVLLHSCLPTLRTFLQRLIDEDLRHVDVISYKHVFGTIMEITATAILKNLRHSFVDAGDDKKFQLLNEKLWIAYLNLCIACIQTRKEQLAKLACSCIRHIITVVGKWMTSSMIDDICSCLNHIMSDCLMALNSLTSLVEQDAGILEDFNYEERRSQSVFCDSSSLTRVFQLATCTQSQKDSVHYEVTIFYKSQATNLRLSLCELACDISTLNLILRCLEFMLLGNSLSPWQRISNSQDNKKMEPNHSGLTSSLHSSNERTNCDESTTSSNQPLLEYLESTQLYELCHHVIECFIAARRFDNLTNLQRYIQKLSRFYSAANMYQFAGSSICVYYRLLLAICCQLDPNQTKIVDTNLRLNNSQPCFISMHDILPCLKDAKLTYDVTIPNKTLKSDSNSPTWGFTALRKCTLYLSQPWDLEELNLSPETVENFLDEEDNRSEMSDRCQSSDDSRSLRSLDINLDYMAYVKRADTIPSPTAKPKIVLDESTQKSIAGHHEKDSATTKKLYRMTSDKVVKGFMDAYKRYNKRKQSVEQKAEDLNEGDNDMVLDRNRSLSEKSSAISAVLALDEQLLKRQAWSSIIESILRLLTSAPDPALQGLLPVIYQPLTSLANHRPLSNPLVVGGNDVGDAFHKWLLRIGQFCNFVPVKSSD